MTATYLTQWREEQVAGHLVDVFEPSQPNEHGHLLIYLHGVHEGRLVSSEPFTAEFERLGLPVVAPMTRRSWWTDRICPEFDAECSAERHLLERVLPWIGERYSAAPPKIGLFGTSMGGQGALRIALKHPETFPVVAAISPAIDFQRLWDEGDETLQAMYDDAEAARQETAILYVRPLWWPRHIFFCCDPTDHRWFESSDRLQMKMSSMGIPFEADPETEAGGHGFGYYNHMAERAVGFLAERLDQERRRLV
ncbi:MAG: prolyl oligopeptidase family serine peptidase [Planctomycetales bacterium]|nr:prolyl oligopeptidase family serine peptidase [Planctomycetales bacterium]